MSNQEQQLLVIPDVILPADINTRYDIHFTDRRIAIVCMGPANRFGYGIGKLHTYPATSSAISPPLTYVDEKDKVEVEEELSTVPLDELLELSKKSCQYAIKEIQTLRLIWGKRPKLAILSEDFESKFTPEEEQFKQMLDLLTTTEPYCSKLEVAGNFMQLQELLAMVVCGNCGAENDFDALCCVNCGQKLWGQTEDEGKSIACGSCGKKNREGSVYCKQCGAALDTDKQE
jgi:transcription elongation factor Elf1